MVDVKETIIFSFKKNGLCYAVLALVILFYTGIIPVHTRKSFVSLIAASNVTELSGKVCSNPVRTAKGSFYRCKIEINSVSGFLPTYTESNLTAQASGLAVVYIPAAIVEAHYPGRLYSAYEGNFGNNKSEGILIETGAYLKLKVRASSDYAKNAFVTESVPPPQFFATDATFLGFENNLWGKIAKFRGLCRLQFKRMMFAWGEAGGLLVALISGSGEYTESALSNDFRNAGLAHVLALSGMHLSFFAGLAAAFSKFFGRRVSNIFSLVAVLLFVWFAGLTPSLLRALIAAILGLIACLCGLNPGSIKILAASFIIHVILQPSDLFQLSFQLSYAALAGILIIGPFVASFFYRLLHPYLASGFAASVGAQTLSAPISLSVFGRFMPGGILASVVVSPLVSVFMTAGVFFILTSFLFPSFVDPLGFVINLLYNCIKFPVQFFAKIPALEL